MHKDSKDQLKILAVQLFHQFARLTIGRLFKNRARCRLKAWMNEKLGANVMNKTLGAHASQVGLS